MTRIVAGTARGRRLAVPAHGTRPTSERAREALFNTVRSELDLTQARVLDLYAGSGAVGLEALSQGAVEAVLVESDRRACSTIAVNIEKLGLPGAVLRCQSAESFVTAPVNTQKFDLIYADPPYAMDSAAVEALLRSLARPDLLVEGAVVVIERAARDAQLRWPEPMTAVKQRRYGEAMLWYRRLEHRLE